jgi:hypothetical protein
MTPDRLEELKAILDEDGYFVTDDIWELIAEVERLNVLIENQSETIQKYSAEHYKRCTPEEIP